MKFGVKTVFVAMVFAAIGASTVAWYSKDTIFRSQVAGELMLPDGKSLPVNRWITFGGEGLRYLGPFEDDQWRLVYPSVNGDQVVHFVTTEGHFETIVTDFKINGPEYRGEYWIRQGRKLR